MQTRSVDINTINTKKLAYVSFLCTTYLNPYKIKFEDMPRACSAGAESLRSVRGGFVCDNNNNINQ